MASLSVAVTGTPLAARGRDETEGKRFVEMGVYSKAEFQRADGKEKRKSLQRNGQRQPRNGTSIRAGGGYALKVRPFKLLLEERSDPVDDFVKRGAGTEAGEGLEFFDRRDAAHHVLEAGFIGFVVGNILDGRRAAGAFFHSLRETFDRDFFGVADVDDFADG